MESKCVHYGEGWMQTIHRQVTIYNDGDWEETRG